MRTNLNVPFDQKDAAARLGARWDPARKTWYCPDETDLAPLLCWVPNMPPLEKRVKRLLGEGAADRAARHANQ